MKNPLSPAAVQTAQVVLRCKEMKPSPSQDMIACLQPNPLSPVELQRVPNTVCLYWK